MLVLLAARPLPTLHAQSTPADTPYWRYSAARRLTHVIPADMNGDGVSELLLAAAVLTCLMRTMRCWNGAIQPPHLWWPSTPST